MKKLLAFLTHSNILVALGGPVVAYITMLLFSMPPRWEPILISFFAMLLIYNLSRYTDLAEDSVNCPDRVKFVRKAGKPIFYSSLMLYIVSIFIALMNGVQTFLISMLFIGIGGLYIILRLKKFVLVKNLFIAAGWSLIVFLVMSYQPVPAYTPLFWTVFLFFFLRVFTDSIISDMMDVTGDAKEKVKTLPVTLGVPKARLFILSLSAFILIAFLYIWNFLLPITPIASFLVVWYFLFVLLLSRMDMEKIPELVLDGEMILWGLAVLLLQLAI